MLRRQPLSRTARAVVVDELGKLSDRLHDTAATLTKFEHQPERAASLREAADFLAHVRKRTKEMI